MANVDQLRHLLLRLDAPLMAFGGETIDHFGVIRVFPAASMLTGMLANALGWRREQSAALQRLQQRLVFGTRVERLGERVTDFHTAQLGALDRGWTTLGQPESRQGNTDSYKSPHLRYRDYHCDAVILVALRLQPADESPTLDALAAALDQPARPLFIGRKTCLPARRLCAGWYSGHTVLEVLQNAPRLLQTPPQAPLQAASQIPAQASLKAPAEHPWMLQWPETEGRCTNDRQLEVCDERQEPSGVHGGWRRVREAVFAPVDSVDPVDMPAHAADLSRSSNSSDPPSPTLAAEYTSFGRVDAAMGEQPAGQIGPTGQAGQTEDQPREQPL